MDLSAAKGRWKGDSAALAGEVVRRLQRNGRLTDLGLGEVDGRVDLRGLSMGSPARRPTKVVGTTRAPDQPLFVSVPIVRKLRFAHLDFSGAVLPDWLLRNVEIVDCRFDDADLRDWAVFDGSVTRTSFRGADLRGMLLGNGTAYRDCSFERADLRGTTSAKVTFEDVDFRGANLHEVEFPDSRFVRCRFGGQMYGTIFGGEAPPDAIDGADFSEAETRYVDFRALNLRDVVPPGHPDNFVIENVREVLDALWREIEADPGHPMAWMDVMLEGWRGWLGPNQQIGIFHRSEFALEDAPDQADTAIAILRRLEGEVLRNDG